LGQLLVVVGSLIISLRRPPPELIPDPIHLRTWWVRWVAMQSNCTLAIGSGISITDPWTLWIQAQR